jgi:class 3 adenylate cyclase
MQTETLTIMLVDLVGSTHLVENSSREQLMVLLEDVTLPIRQAVHENGGTIIKFTGDGYLATFRSASDSLHAAEQIISAFRAQPTLPTGEHLEGCRVALHTADVVVKDKDVLGEGVVTVARLEKHVPTNHIYVTNTVRDVAKSSEFEFESVGDLLLRGLTNPVRVFRLLTEPFSGIEEDVYLCIADLVGLSQQMTELPIDQVNRIMLKWVGMQRAAVGDLSGRLRSIVGDNLVTTYDTADEAADSLLRLEGLVNAHNHADHENLPLFQFSAVICKGDLFVLSLGINGPLVTHGFRLLNQMPAGHKQITAEVYNDLSRHKARFYATDSDVYELT